MKFGWDTKKEQENGISLLMACAIIAGLIGNALGGKLMQKGRRLILLVGTFTSTFGISLMLSTHFPVHLTGDCFYALGLGLVGPATYRYIEEYCPPKILSATFAGV